jgi:hypothetical protein
MTPIANLYVVAHRVAAGCGGRAAQSSVADAELTHILIHEIGHAIEFQLLRGAMGGDRARAEGFASWFEMYASEFSSVVPSGSVRRTYYSTAARAFAGGATLESFDGGFEGYAIASTPFAAIAARRGVRGIAEIYDAMTQKQLDLAGAIDARLGWNRERLLDEAKRVVK